MFFKKQIDTKNLKNEKMLIDLIQCCACFFRIELIDQAINSEELAEELAKQLLEKLKDVHRINMISTGQMINEIGINNYLIIMENIEIKGILKWTSQIKLIC